jgi:MFS superfamily sulfate permease-like transporter
MGLIMEIGPSMAVTYLMTLATVIVASVIAAIPFLRAKKSDIPTLPAASTWLQQKHAFRSNGPKLIEQGFLTVSALRFLRILTHMTIANVILRYQTKTGVFRVVYLSGTLGSETLY